MTHRIDLKILGFESVKYGSKAEIEKLATKFDDKDVVKKVVKVDNDLWELYVKR